MFLFDKATAFLHKLYTTKKTSICDIDVEYYISHGALRLL